MGVAVGLILIAFGAILTWAVDASVSGLNVTAVGVILMIVGLLVVILDFFWWRSWTSYATSPGRSGMTYERDTAAPVQPVHEVHPAAGRRVVANEEVGGPPAGP